MIKRISQKKLIEKITTKNVLNRNIDAFKVYDTYKRTIDVIERAKFASSKSNRITPRVDIGSTLNFEINRYGACSTIAKKI